MEITNERYEELIKTEMLYRMTKNALKIGVPYPHILAMLGEPPVRVIKPISETAPTTEPDEPKKPRATIKRRIPQETINRIVELTNECKTVKEIAEEVGVSAPTVAKYQKEVYARKCQQLDVLIDLLERENKRLRELIAEQEKKNEKDDTGKAS